MNLLMESHTIALILECLREKGVVEEQQACLLRLSDHCSALKAAFFLAIPGEC